MANGDARRRRARVDVGDATRDESRDAIAVASASDARRRDATRRATNALASLRDYDDGGDDDDDEIARDDGTCEALPLGWKRAIDAASGRGYYYNKSLNASSWTRPTTTTTTRERGTTKGREGDDGGDGEDDETNDATLNARTRARGLMEAYEARCADVGARAAATPSAALRYAELMEVVNGRRGDVGAERLRAIERGMDADVEAYEAWTREAEEETAREEAAATTREGEADAADAAAPVVVDARAKGTIRRPPAPPLPTHEAFVAPPAPPAKKPKRSAAAALSHAKRLGGDVQKWAKLRDVEAEDARPAKASERMEAERARELEEWRKDRIRDGVDGSKNPNFLPVGDWRARVKAAAAKTKLEEFRARQEDQARVNKTATIERSNADDASAELEAPLPPGWRAFVDDESGRVYFGNFDTKQTTWERPR